MRRTVHEPRRVVVRPGKLGTRRHARRPAKPLSLGDHVALISGIETVYYRICNMDRAVAFYEGVLGLPLTNRADNDWAEFAIGSQELALEGELATAPHQGGATVVLRTDDIQSLATTLRENSTTMGDVEDLGGSYLLEFYDPDGNKLVAMQAVT